VNVASGGVVNAAGKDATAFKAGDEASVCPTRAVATSRAIKADRVIDYTQEDFTQLDDRFDLMLDVAGSRPWWHVKHVLAPNATVVMIGGPRKSRLLGPMGHLARFRIAAIGSGRKVLFFVAKFNKPDMETLRDLLASGQIRSVLDPQYPLSELPAALDVMGEGHCRGKIVVTI
jgi:NADPH:quinone reductase-like Zn-dependent oxidoreductase